VTPITASAGPDPLLDVRSLVVTFKVAGGNLWKRATVHAVDGVSLQLARGETLGLVGESGSGKSTTARAILQLVPVNEGSITFEGSDLASVGRDARRLVRRRAQMVFQDPFGSLNARLKIGQIIREPLDIHHIGDGASRRQRVNELLDLVGLPADAIGRYPHEFSGGQQQRVGIARALAVEPSLIVCDEPVAALDVSIQAQILQLFKNIQRQTGVAYLFIAHDLNVVRHMSQRTAVMYLGKIVESSPSATVFVSPRHPYTKMLISAIPDPNPNAPHGAFDMRGEIPSPTDPPSGCRFRTRCPYAQDRCASEEPTLEPAGDDVWVACHFWREIP